MVLESQDAEKPSAFQDLKRSSLGLDGVLENLEDFMNSHDEQSSAKEDTIEDEMLASSREEQDDSLLKSNTNLGHDTSVNSNLDHNCSDINAGSKRDSIPNELTLNFSTLHIDSEKTPVRDSQMSELNEALKMDPLISLNLAATVNDTTEEIGDKHERDAEELFLSFKNEQNDVKDSEVEKDVKTDDEAKTEQELGSSSVEKPKGDHTDPNNVQTVAEVEAEAKAEANTQLDKTTDLEGGNDEKEIKTSEDPTTRAASENKNFMNAEIEKGVENDMKESNTSAADADKEHEKLCAEKEKDCCAEDTTGAEMKANNQHSSNISVDEGNEKTSLEAEKDIEQTEKIDTSETVTEDIDLPEKHASGESAKSACSDKQEAADAETPGQNEELSSKEQKHKDLDAHIEKPATEKSLSDAAENAENSEKSTTESFEEFKDSNNCQHELGCNHAHPVPAIASENEVLEKSPVNNEALVDYVDLDDDIDALLADLHNMDEDNDLLAKELLEELVPETETDPAVVKKFHFKIFTSLASMDRNMVSRTNKTISLLLAQEGVTEDLLELCDVGTDSTAKKLWYRKACDPVTRESVPLPGVFRESNEDDLFIGNYTMIEDFVEDCSMEEKMWPELVIKSDSGQGNKEDSENSIIWRLLGKKA